MALRCGRLRPPHLSAHIIPPLPRRGGGGKGVRRNSILMRQMKSHLPL